jgi:hypothetical protein
MWQNKTRPNKTARVPYAYIASEEDPLVLIPDPEVVGWVEDALDHLDQGHSSRRVAAWLGEKTGKTILNKQQKLLKAYDLRSLITEFLYLTHPHDTLLHKCKLMQTFNNCDIFMLVFLRTKDQS